MWRKAPTLHVWGGGWRVRRSLRRVFERFAEVGLEALEAIEGFLGLLGDEGAPYRVKIVEGGRLVEELDGFRRLYSSRIGGQ